MVGPANPQERAAIAWKAQHRSNGRYRKLLRRSFGGIRTQTLHEARAPCESLTHSLQGLRRRSSWSGWSGSSVTSNSSSVVGVVGLLGDIELELRGREEVDTSRIFEPVGREETVTGREPRAGDHLERASADGNAENVIRAVSTDEPLPPGGEPRRKAFSERARSARRDLDPHEPERGPWSLLFGHEEVARRRGLDEPPSIA